MDPVGDFPHLAFSVRECDRVDRIAIEKALHRETDFRSALGDDVRPRMTLKAAQAVRHETGELGAQSARPLRCRPAISSHHQHASGHTADRTLVEQRRIDQGQRGDAVRVSGRQSLPVGEPQPPGGDMRFLDPEMPKQIDETFFDRTSCCWLCH